MGCGASKEPAVAAPVATTKSAPLKPKEPESIQKSSFEPRRDDMNTFAEKKESEQRASNQELGYEPDQHKNLRPEGETVSSLYELLSVISSPNLWFSLNSENVVEYDLLGLLCPIAHFYVPART